MKPDLILLTGGTDGGDTDHVVHNARRLRSACGEIPLVVAANRSAEDPLRGALAGRAEVHFTDNVLPRLNQLNLEPARETIRQVFLRRIVAAKGLDRLQARARVLMPTPEAVFQAVVLASRGAEGRPGLGELVAVDIGGATTDVYSCATGKPTGPRTVTSGLPEPFAKRTVEADVGMRHTVASLLEQSDIEQLARQARVTVEAVRSYARSAASNLRRLPSDESEERIETALACAACRLAVTRHAGKVREVYTPEGRMLVQEGKDLTGVGVVIGSGGPIARGGHGVEILRAACRSGDAVHLRPERPLLFVDERYILWAMGLLAQVAPGAALAIIRKYVVPAGSGPEPDGRRESNQ